MHFASGLTIALCLLPLITPVWALTLKPGSLWPDAKIPVCWEEKTRSNKQERDLIRKAVKWTWERESAVQFTGWRKCRKGDPGVQISFDATYPKTAGRGVNLDGVPRGVLLPSLWSLAALSINMKAPVHEFGHVLGFGHEYARPDAPNHGVCATGTRAGKRYTEDDTAITPFDFDSIMVACLKGATVRFSRGTPRLSAGDIFGLIRSYGSNPKNVLDLDEAGDRFGAAVLVKDLDGDEIPDLLVGAPGEDDGRGSVYLYRGDKIRGFRPWARVEGDHGPGFGSAFGWAPATGEGRGVAVALTDDGAAFSLRIERRKPPVARLRSQPPSIILAPVEANAPPSLDAYGFPGMDGPKVLALADLNQDGNMDLIAGLPEGDSRVQGSGVVVVYRGMLKPGRNGSRFSPWYWFGQAY